MDYKLRKGNLLDTNSHRENVTSHFHKFRLADKDYQNSVSCIKCQQNLLPTEINIKNHVRELCKKNLIVCVICNSA